MSYFVSDLLQHNTKRALKINPRTLKFFLNTIKATINNLKDNNVSYYNLP